MKKLFILATFLISFHQVFPQQLPDNTYKPEIQNPAYPDGEGTVVLIDEGHYNYHTMNGRYRTFANVLEHDGYIVKRFNSKFSTKKLAQAKILVISNALNRRNERNWTLPCPSAFTDAEIEAVKEWVLNGGSLFLIADHMPMAGGATKLGNVFGFKFTNGFAMKKKTRGHSIFNVANGTLKESIITRGRDKNERVNEVATFTGQAFLIPSDAHPVLVFDDDHINLLPERAWKFNKDPPKHWISKGGARVLISGLVRAR